MSKSRMQQKVRKNPDFVACTRYLDGLGLKWEVLAPTGTGHPKLAITLPNGEVYRHPIPCTPRQGTDPNVGLSKLKRRLEPMLGR